MTTTRRYLSAAFAGACAALAVSLTGSIAEAQQFPADEAALYAEAQKEGVVVWYTSAPLEPMKLVAADFMKKYPGVNVETLRYVGVAQYQRVMEEASAGQYLVDVMLLSDYASMKTLADDGFLASWEVPDASRVPGGFKIENFAFSPWSTDIAIVYNKDKLTDEEIGILDGSWKGVLDPRFKGRFAVSNMKCGVCYAGLSLFLDSSLPDFGVDFLKAVAAQSPSNYTDLNVAIDRVVAGEHDFVFWAWESPAVSKWAQGAPLRWIHPNPTPLFGNAWQAVASWAPHPHAARLFQNWMLSDEGAVSQQTHFGGLSVLENMPDTRTVTKEPWYDPIEQSYEVDYERWQRDFHESMELWDSILKQGG